MEISYTYLEPVNSKEGEWVGSAFSNLGRFRENNDIVSYLAFGALAWIACIAMIAAEPIIMISKSLYTAAVKDLKSAGLELLQGLKNELFFLFSSLGLPVTLAYGLCYKEGLFAYATPKLFQDDDEINDAGAADTAENENSNQIPSGSDKVSEHGDRKFGATGENDLGRGAGQSRLMDDSPEVENDRLREEIQHLRTMLIGAREIFEDLRKGDEFEKARFENNGGADEIFRLQAENAELKGSLQFATQDVDSLGQAATMQVEQLTHQLEEVETANRAQDVALRRLQDELDHANRSQTGQMRRIRELEAVNRDQIQRFMRYNRVIDAIERFPQGTPLEIYIVDTSQSTKIASSAQNDCDAIARRPEGQLTIPGRRGMRARIQRIKKNMVDETFSLGSMARNSALTEAAVQRLVFGEMSRPLAPFDILVLQQRDSNTGQRAVSSSLLAIMNATEQTTSSSTTATNHSTGALVPVGHDILALRDLRRIDFMGVPVELLNGGTGRVSDQLRSVLLHMMQMHAVSQPLNPSNRLVAPNRQKSDPRVEVLEQ